MSQPDDDPRIQAFLTWVDKTCVAGLADPASKVRPKFLPLKSLKEHFEANQYRNLKGLLHAVFQPGELPVDADEVAEKCPIVFCTLLLIGRAKYIRTIVQHDHLQDAHLPFHPENPPKDFPNDTSDQDPTALLTRFCEKQWMLCVPAIDYQVHRNFEANRILPIMFLDKLSGGGSAILYKVVLYQNYNKLHTSDDISPVQANPFANTFVLKTYFGRDAERYYTNEVSAFKRLRTRTTSMIGFFGSFKQGDRYNVLLEYADKGPLEKYFKTIPPPTSGEDIIRFWTAMFGLIEALLRIHEGEPPLSSDSSVQPLQGWHQDVKPSNILVSSKSETIASPYNWRFKLADLGISHFKSQVSSLEDNVDHDSQGTGTYGAPECCRTDEVLMKSKLKVKQNVDVWSLGAVFSEAAVWLVEGYQGLKEYRNNRRSATKNSPGIRGSDCFHDGEKMLDTVHQRHKRLADGFRKNDVITESVLGMVEYMMLDEHSRLPTRTCWAKSQNILHEAERELKAKRSGNEISTPTKRKPPPSVVSSKSSATSLKEPVQEYKDTGDQGPGVFQPSLVDSPGGLATGETEVQFNSTEDHRNGFKQIPSHYQQQRLPTKSGSASGSEFANPNFYPPMSLRSQTFGSHRGTHQVTQSVPVNNNGFKFYSEDNEDDERKEFLPNHRSQASERHKVVSMPLGLTRQPEESFQKTPQRGLSTQAGRTLQNVQATFAQDSYADTDFSRQRYSSSNHLEYMSPATYTDDNRDPVWDSSHQHQKAAGYVSPPPQQTVLRPHFNSTFQNNPRENANSHWVPSTSGQSRPPNKYQPSEYLSPPVPVTPEPSVKHEPPAILQVGTASAWLARKGKISELEGYFLFDRLKARDHVFIIDDALSMSKHWQELLPLFKVLAYMVKSADPDGIDLHFTMSDEKFNSKEYRWSINSSTKLVNIVNHRRLKGSSNITYRLESILAPYEAKLTDSHNLRRGGAVRPLNIYIMTDGIWESQCDAQSAIKSIVSKLIKLEYPKDSKQIGIQFIRFGNDPTGVKRLKDLDDNLGQDMDIVDTTPSNGNVWKMLLGAIDKTFDEAYEGPSTAAN